MFIGEDICKIYDYVYVYAYVCVYIYTYIKYICQTLSLFLRKMYAL